MIQTALRKPCRETTARNDEMVKLRGLTAHLITAQESERRRISREIHDDLIQRIGVLEIQLEEMDRDSVRASIAALREDLHRICYGLHPVLLDNLGLAAAVESLCEEYTQTRGFQVTFCHREVPKLPPNISLCLYRVVQEALHNVAKHARADQASVLLSGSGNCVRVVIRDTGCGFDLARARMNSGLGLTSICERVRLAGGHCDIHARPGHGTRIAVSVPLPSAANRSEDLRTPAFHSAAASRAPLVSQQGSRPGFMPSPNQNLCFNKET